MFIKILALSLSLAYNLYQSMKISRTKKQLDNIVLVLEDIQNGNVKRRILTSDKDIISNIAYRINEIVYNYEKEISNFKIDNESNKELMTSLSHDLRTPLTTLIGYLDAIDRKVVSGDEKEEYFQIARLKAYDLKDYIDNLFEWFKLQSSELYMDIVKVEITELTRQILLDWILILEEEKIEFDILMPENPIFTYLDKDAYRRIINNLMQNIIKHSGADKVMIDLKVKNMKVLISIKDNGIGIDKDKIDYIFDRLYKCDSGRSEKGSGLGLAITKEMAEKMKGNIRVESGKHNYTKFILSFPLE